MKRLLWLALLLPSLSWGQQLHLFCNHAAAVVCTTASPANGASFWDPQWLMGGKSESNFNQLFGPAWPTVVTTNSMTWGNFNTAVAESTVANSTIPAQIMGTTPAGLAALSYGTNDAVSRFTLENCAPPVAAAVAGTFTTTSFVPTVAFSAGTVSLFRAGMFVITQESGNFFRGQITTWAGNGSSITVSGWFQQGNSAGGQTPTGGDTVTINPFTKCWGENTVVTLPAGTVAGAYANVANGGSAALHEYDANDVAGIGNMWGVDVDNLQAGITEANAYLARGKWVLGYSCPGPTGITSCFNSSQTTGNAFQDTATMTSGNLIRSNFFNVNFAGQVDVGFLAQTGSSPIVMHSSGHAGGDASFTVTGGSGAADGNLSINAASVATNRMIVGGATSPSYNIAGAFGPLNGIQGLGGAGAFYVQRWNVGNPSTLVIGSSQSGTIGSFSAYPASTQFGRIAFAADTGTQLSVGAAIVASTTSVGAWSNTNNGSGLSVAVVPNNTTTLVTSFGFNQDETVTMATFTVATLPTCNAGAKGELAMVSDANAPAYNAILAGGGAVLTLALCNGTNWTAH